MRKLAIIGAGPMACVYAERARQMGVETHCFAWAEGAVARDSVDQFHDISVTDVGAIVDRARELGINGVVPTTELTIYPAAAVAHELGLNGNPVDVAREITNKYRNRLVTSDVAGLHHPRYWLVREPDDVSGLDVAFPAVVKPTSEGGKRGVSVVTSRDELDRAIAYATDEKKDSSDIIVEEFLPEGVECSVETLSYHGDHRVIQVTEKWSSGAPHCVELGHHQPARISAEQRALVEDVMPRALDAVGVRNGCCHTEVKLCDGKVYLIEFNARPGGDHIAYPLTELSTGYPYITGIIEVALDCAALPPRESLGHDYAGICFVTQQTSFLKPVFDECERFDWCYERHEVPGPLQPLTHNRGYATNYFIYHSSTTPPAFLADLGPSLS